MHGYRLISPDSNNGYYNVLYEAQMFTGLLFHAPVEGSSDTTWTHLGLFYQLYKFCIIPLRRRETRLSYPDNPARWNEYVRNTIQETARGRIITHSKQENSLKNIRKLNSGNQYIVSVSYVKGDGSWGGGGEGGTYIVHPLWDTSRLGCFWDLSKYHGRVK